MSAHDHIDSMNPDAPGTDIYLRARTMLTDLGYEVREKWSYGTMCDTTVSLGGEDICRVLFSGNQDAYTLNAVPLDPASEKLIVNVTGRTHHPEGMWLNEELDHFETLFRALRVRDGHLAKSEFPSDYSLKKWVALASTVSLPRERGIRRSACEDVVIRPLEAPVDRHPSKSPASQAIVRTARLLDREFDRNIAIDLAITAARQSPSLKGDGTQDDPGLSWLARSAVHMLRDRRRQMDVAWNMSSWDRSLFAPLSERGNVNQPLVEADLAPDAEAPSMSPGP